MKVLNKVTAGDFEGVVYETSLEGKVRYTFKIFYRVGKKKFCIDRCYVYLLEQQYCYEKMTDALDVALGMRENLLNWKGC